LKAVSEFADQQYELIDGYFAHFFELAQIASSIYLFVDDVFGFLAVEYEQMLLILMCHQHTLNTHIPFVVLQFRVEKEKEFCGKQVFIF
jgi:hypothetical protein